MKTGMVLALIASNTKKRNGSKIYCKNGHNLFFFLVTLEFPSLWGNMALSKKLYWFYRDVFVVHSLCGVGRTNQYYVEMNQMNSFIGILCIKCNYAHWARFSSYFQQSIQLKRNYLTCFTIILLWSIVLRWN